MLLAVAVVLAALGATLMALGAGKKEMVISIDPVPSPSGPVLSSSSPTTSTAAPTPSVIATQVPSLPIVKAVMPTHLLVKTIDGGPQVVISKDFHAKPVYATKITGGWAFEPPVNVLADLDKVYLELNPDTNSLMPASQPGNPAQFGIYVAGHTCYDRTNWTCYGAFDQLQEIAGRKSRIWLTLDSGVVLVYDVFWTASVDKATLASSLGPNGFYDGEPGVLHLSACQLADNGTARTNLTFAVKARLVAVQLPK